jgi:hypothetical protein
MQNGKGDSPRKRGVSEETWSENWARIFGPKQTDGKKSFSEAKKHTYCHEVLRMAHPKN